MEFSKEAEAKKSRWGSAAVLWCNCKFSVVTHLSWAVSVEKSNKVSEPKHFKKAVSMAYLLAQNLHPFLKKNVFFIIK